MTRHLRTLITATAAFGLVLAGVGTAQAAGTLSATPTTIAGATLDVTVPTAASPKGVSPDVYYDDSTGTYYLYTTNMPTGVYTSTDGTNWTPVAGASMPQGFDWSVVKMGPNNYRLYYSTINPNGAQTVSCTKMRKEFRYATSTDLVRWTPQPGVPLDDIGCGVPHVLKKTDGSYLLYWNTITAKHGMHIATSPDGLTWTKLPGIIADDPDLVDPAPLQMPDGTFLMVASTTGSRGQGQQLRILSSSDGITWSLRDKALYAPSGVSVLDPALKLIGQQLRVWFGYAPGMDHNNSKIASGLLNLKAGTVDNASSSSSSASNASAKIKPCKKAGSKMKSGSKVAVCTKVKGKLIWVLR
jgi:hypothetical protein